ncbi:MAG: glycoside hydrolase family 28 protein [Syntrophaceae bacterium]|nr:glycoside hydrolase family 28 protein [Syntrophaceae bacterium]
MKRTISRKLTYSAIGVMLVLLCIAVLITPTSQPKSGWEQLPKLLDRIKAPEFPDRDFNITDYGAVGDGKFDCTQAFKTAITLANAAGGGRVTVPAGIFLTGPIHLKSNVNLFVSEAGVIKFSPDPNKYLPAVYTRWEGVEGMLYSPLIYAYEQENIAITGTGTLDGQGSENWWLWKKIQKEDRDKLFGYGRDGVPVRQRVFTANLKLRPPMIQPYKCKNILIEGVTIKNSPFWHIHPVLSQNITVKNVTVEGLGPNNDGCNPESCKDILIEGCYFNTGDDCIAIKSGRNNDGRRLSVPTENVIVQNCKMKEGHGGVVMGSEMTGGVRNVFAENCIMDSPNLDRAIRLKTNAVRGGFLENIYVRNITVGEVREAVLKINFYYEEGDKGDFTPHVRNVNMENVTSKKSKYALLLNGYERSPISDVHIKNCAFNNVKSSNSVGGIKNVILENVKINGEVFNGPLTEQNPLGSKDNM